MIQRMFFAEVSANQWVTWAIALAALLLAFFKAWPDLKKTEKLRQF